MISKSAKIISIGRAHFLLKEGKKVYAKYKDNDEEYKINKVIYQSTNIDVTVVKTKLQKYIPIENLILYTKKEKVYKENKPQFVYLMEDINYVKIGYTDNVNKRLQTIKVGNASVKLASCYECEDAYEEEQYLHDKFAEFNAGGEWFFKDKSIFKHFNCKSVFPPVIEKIELYLDKKVWEFIEVNQISTYKLEHAVRLNGVCDVWYKSYTIYDIVNKKYHKYNSIEEMIEIVTNIVLTNTKKDPIKKTTTGKMSYKEYINNKRQ